MIQSDKNDVSIAKETIELVLKKSDILDNAKVQREILKVSQKDDPYRNFQDFKKSYGKAGKGYEWHHLVEQSQVKKSGFDISQINNGNNMIPLDAITHRKVSGFYSRKIPGTNMSFRDWLANKGFSFEVQQLIAILVLEIYGIKVK